MYFDNFRCCARLNSLEKSFKSTHFNLKRGNLCSPEFFFFKLAFLTVHSEISKFEIYPTLFFRMKMMKITSQPDWNISILVEVGKLVNRPGVLFKSKMLLPLHGKKIHVNLSINTLLPFT